MSPQASVKDELIRDKAMDALLQGLGAGVLDSAVADAKNFIGAKAQDGELREKALAILLAKVESGELDSVIAQAREQNVGAEVTPYSPQVAACVDLRVNELRLRTQNGLRKSAQSGKLGDTLEEMVAEIKVEQQAAVKIQSTFRGKAARREVAGMTGQECTSQQAAKPPISQEVTEVPDVLRLKVRDAMSKSVKSGSLTIAFSSMNEMSKKDGQKPVPRTSQQMAEETRAALKIHSTHRSSIKTERSRVEEMKVEESTQPKTSAKAAVPKVKPSAAPNSTESPSGANPKKFQKGATLKLEEPRTTPNRGSVPQEPSVPGSKSEQLKIPALSRGPTLNVEEPRNNRGSVPQESSVPESPKQLSTLPRGPTLKELEPYNNRGSVPQEPSVKKESCRKSLAHSPYSISINPNQSPARAAQIQYLQNLQGSKEERKDSKGSARKGSRSDVLSAKEDVPSYPEDVLALATDAARTYVKDLVQRISGRVSKTLRPLQTIAMHVVEPVSPQPQSPVRKRPRGAGANSGSLSGASVRPGIRDNQICTEWASDAVKVSSRGAPAAPTRKPEPPPVPPSQPRSQAPPARNQIKAAPPEPDFQRPQEIQSSAVGYPSAPGAAAPPRLPQGAPQAQKNAPPPPAAQRPSPRRPPPRPEGMADEPKLPQYAQQPKVPPVPRVLTNRPMMPAADSEVSNQAKSTSISLPAINSERQRLAWAEELGEAARFASTERCKVEAQAYKISRPTLDPYNHRPICVLGDPPRRKKRDRQGRSKSQKKGDEEQPGSPSSPKPTLPFIPLNGAFKSQMDQGSRARPSPSPPVPQKSPEEEEKRKQDLSEWRHGIAESALRFARTADVPLSQLQNFGTFALD